MTFQLGKKGDILLREKIRHREADPGRGSRSRSKGQEVWKCKVHLEKCTLAPQSVEHVGQGGPGGIG